ILSWTVYGPLRETSRAYPESMPIAPSAEMYMFMAPTRLNLGMLLALVLAIRDWAAGADSASRTDAVRSEPSGLLRVLDGAGSQLFLALPYALTLIVLASVG